MVLIIPLILSMLPPPQARATASAAQLGYGSPIGNLPADHRRSCMYEDPMMNSFIFCAPHDGPLESPDADGMCMVPPPETEKGIITYCNPLKGCYNVSCVYRINSSIKCLPSALAELTASCIWNNGTESGNDFYPDHIHFQFEDEVCDAERNMTRTKQSASSRQLIREKSILDHRKQQRTFTTAAIAVASALLALLCTIIAGLLLWCKRNKKPEVDEVPSIQLTELCTSAPRRYSHRELTVATRGFADEMKIGRGGFGPVYRGYLGRHVAIKVLLPQGSSSSVQGAKEFESEVKVLSRLRHRNIVQLLGWCHGPSSRDLLLVYEFVPNGSLDKHLYNPHRILAWSDRYNIALGVGSAILYLHTECEQCVVHGDIKPANIMLDSSFQAKLGDFGLARLLDHGADSQTTEVLAGTFGYIDPELVNSRRPSAASDVFSFGIVLLEIACGRRPTSTVGQANGASVVHLLNWVGNMYRRNAILGAADRRLDGEFDEQQMKRVLVTGLWCAHHDQSQRPSIAEAMDVLRREDAELPEPGQATPSPDDAVRSLEEGAYGGGDSAGEDSPCEDSPAETEYHTSGDSLELMGGFSVCY